MGSEILGKEVGVFPGIWAIQEHKLVGHGLKKARRMLDRCGWGASFEPALVTPKLGKSSGVAVLWDRKMVGVSDVAGGPAMAGSEHRFSWTTLTVQGLKLHVGSFYGDVRSQAATEAMIEGAMGLVESGDLWAIGGDFNVPASEMIRWFGGRGKLEVVRAGTPTCFSSGGAPTELDYLLVSPDMRRLVAGCHAVERTLLATHLPVVLKIAVGGRVEPLAKRAAA